MSGSSKFLLLACALAAGMVPSRANLGDTMGLCIARYGQPASANLALTPVISHGGNAFIFKKNGYTIMALFVKGVVGCQIILKENGSGFSDQEIAALLQADAAGGKWREDDLPHAIKYWLRDDGARASYPGANHSPQCGLAFESKAYFEAANLPSHF